MNKRFGTGTALLPSMLLSLMLVACAGETPEAMLASAKDYLAKNDSKAAVIQIKNALQKNPDLAEARFLLGKALFESGDPISAEVELRKAIALKFSSDQAVPLLMRTLVAQGKNKKLIEEFGTAQLGAAVGDADIQTTLAVAYASLGDTGAAGRSLAAALQAKPDHVPALMVQARLKASQGDTAGASTLIAGILEKEPGNADALKFRGDLARAKADMVSAEKDYRQSLSAKPDFVLAHLALVDLLMGQGKVDAAAMQVDSMRKAAPGHPLLWFLDARIAFLKKDLPKAREAIQQFLKRLPDSTLGLQLAGTIEYQAKAFTQAELYLSKLVRVAPDSVDARRQLAMTYLRLSQPSRAQAVLDPVLEKIEQSSNMLALAGEIALQNGDAAKAERYFAKSSALDPKDVQKRTALALSHLARGDAGAFSELEQIAETDTGTRADMVLIATSVARAQYSNALKAIERLEKKLGDSPVPHHLRAGVFMAKKDETAAKASFEKALSRNPAYLPSAAALAALEFRDNNPDQARKRFESVLAADAKNVPAMIALAELKAKTGGSKAEVVALLDKGIAVNPDEPAPRLALIDYHRQTKDIKNALTVAQAAVTAIPDRPELQEVLGRAQLANGEGNQALATFGKMAATQPNSPLPHLLIAEAHLAAKNRESAMQSLRKALDIKPDLLEAQRGLINLSLSSGAIDQALAIVRDIKGQRPKEAIGHFIEGEVRGAAKAWDAAAMAFRSGLEITPAPEYAIKLHGVLVLAGKTADAERFASAWPKSHPKDIAFRLYLGDRALADQKLAVSAAHYRAVVDLQPNNALALNNLAYVLAKQKDSRALEIAEKAHQLAPETPAFMDTLAMILLDKGNSVRAVGLQRKAVELAPKSPEIRANLVRVLARSGDKAAARKEFEMLRTLSDKTPGKEVMDALAKEL